MDNWLEWDGVRPVAEAQRRAKQHGGDGGKL